MYVSITCSRLCIVFGLVPVDTAMSNKIQVDKFDHIVTVMEVVQSKIITPSARGRFEQVSVVKKKTNHHSLRFRHP